MTDDASLRSLTAAIHAVARLIDRAGGQGFIIGGVAVSLLSRARSTHDVDAILIGDPANAEQILTLAESCGLHPRIKGAADFAMRSRVLLLEHRPSATPVDLAFGSIVFEDEAVGRRISHDFEGIAIPLPTPEDLIIMKAVAGRPRDFEDIASLFRAFPRGLDLKRIEIWVKAFSEILDLPERLQEVLDLERSSRR
jgi:Nucleotidyl transferase AbiEii toxin, Type IV TA system